MFRIDLVAVIFGLLCAVQIHGDCIMEKCNERSNPVCEITCIHNMSPRIRERKSGEHINIQNIPYGSVTFTLKLEKITDVTGTIDVIKTVRDRSRIESITFSDSNLTTLPYEVIKEDLNVLSISNSNILSINLNILPPNNDLCSLNLSHNIIEEFETKSAPYESTQHLTDIDLSYNKLHHVPPNCFYGVRDSLKHLDLSHNQLSNVDFYAFSNLSFLRTLRLSHNKLTSLGFYLYPLKNLWSLYFDHNLLNHINVEVFDRSIDLGVLDLSFNDIGLIEDRSFGFLTHLVNLNLSHNRLTAIKEILLRNNTGLWSLDLSFNNVGYVEAGTFFSLKNLQNIGLQSALTMTIQEHAFAGIKVEKLNFAGSTIETIRDRSFISLGNSLRTLNLSSCAIREISETALDTLTELNELDLSNNQLSEISFRMVDLKNLSMLDLNNNSIREIKPQTFEHLSSLTVLDLSNNDIETIPTMSFKNLKNLETFKILHNNLYSTIISNTFYGLEKVKHLELINTKINKWDNYAFSGLKSLKSLNASHGQLAYIDYYAFTETGNIEILDLSHNLIQNFNVKLLPNNKLKALYINDNQIGSFSKKLFEGISALEILNLSKNSLYSVEPFSFTPLNSLSFLDLSHNPELKFNGNAFDGLNQLETVLLRNVSNQISFESSNLSIKNLDISSSAISNLSSLHIHKINKLTKLDLSQNKITVLDQYSFGDIAHLSSFTWLNLSHNDIVIVNAGTFLKANYILYLDLSYNKLDRIQFGTLSGLNRLHVLDLSNNTLYNFKMALLYNVPSVSIIYLDNNKIYSLGLPVNNIYNLRTLSIGGNELSCDDLIDLKINRNILAAKVLDYYTENVDGIVCTTYPTVDIGSNQSFGEDRVYQ